LLDLCTVQSVLCVCVLVHCTESIENGTYDERDVERVRTDDEYVTGFIKSFFKRRDMNIVLAKLDKVLTWRKTTGLNGELIGY